MTDTIVNVKISENNGCIYEDNSSVTLNENNLSGLISCMKQSQIKINNFLTSLIEKQDVSAANRLTSESESDFEEEIEVNPKKCKLID